MPDTVNCLYRMRASYREEWIFVPALRQVSTLEPKWLRTKTLKMTPNPSAQTIGPYGQTVCQETEAQESKGLKSPKKSKRKTCINKKMPKKVPGAGLESVVVRNRAVVIMKFPDTKQTGGGSSQLVPKMIGLSCTINRNIALIGPGCRGTHPGPTRACLHGH